MAIFRKTADPLDPHQPDGKIPDYSDKSNHSTLPGDALANPFRTLNPSFLRKLYDRIQDQKTKKMIWKALKEWSRQYSDSLINPYKYEKYFEDIQDDFPQRDATAEAIVARIASETVSPHINLFYYQGPNSTQSGDMGETLHTQDGGGDSLKDPVLNDKNRIFPKDYEQNLPENPTWGEGDLSSPYEGKIPEALDALRGVTKMSKFFDDFVWTSDDAIDQYFTARTASVKKVSKTIKVADLEHFVRVGNILIHKSENDLWAMEEDDSGNIVISRLFDGDMIK